MEPNVRKELESTMLKLASAKSRLPDVAAEIPVDLSNKLAESYAELRIVELNIKKLLLKER